VIQKTPVMRICISCKKKFNRIHLLKITKDHQKGIMLKKGIGRSAYICKSKKCYEDSKIKKKLQKALKTSLKPEFVEIFEKEIESYNL
tara:strand:+ start:76 stop:339 length:264 start_codon:yes stop_codon:yes gene_type:complete